MRLDEGIFQICACNKGTYGSCDPGRYTKVSRRRSLEIAREALGVLQEGSGSGKRRIQDSFYFCRKRILEFQLSLAFFFQLHFLSQLHFLLFSPGFGLLSKKGNHFFRVLETRNSCPNRRVVVYGECIHEIDFLLYSPNRLIINYYRALPVLVEPEPTTDPVE